MPGGNGRQGDGSGPLSGLSAEKTRQLLVGAADMFDQPLKIQTAPAISLSAISAISR
jgi:hypothetical protein